uniref:DDE-1 domain-containing protein n=1 Tax=Amphimedon queenslandica TaxID=400682 RepID=A0A1X7TVV7_AMPQE
MEIQGFKRVEITGIADKRQITAVLCGNLVDDFLPVQLIYQGKSDRCHPHYEFPDDWDITHSPRHWSTETTMLQYSENIILPYIEGVHHRLYCDSAAALVIIDNFKGQITPAVNIY